MGKWISPLFTNNVFRITALEFVDMNVSMPCTFSDGRDNIMVYSSRKKLYFIATSMEIKMDVSKDGDTHCRG